MSTAKTLLPNMIYELCVNTLLFLAVEIIQKANSDHPGLPLGSVAMSRQSSPHTYLFGR
jgi:transketolase